MSYQGARGALTLVVLTIIFTGVSCQGDSQSGFYDELGVTCSGKCDGVVDSVISIYRDGRDAPLGDLLIEDGLDLATDELNADLSLGNHVEVGAGFESPQLYREAELNELVTGLLHRFGERELTTVVNQLRQNHLSTSNDEVYAEAAFRISAGAGYNWNTPIRGLGDGDGSGFLGFDTGATVESRVIAPFDSALQGSVQNMLSTLQNTRHFVLPRDMGDVIEMEPGELVAMSGSGRLGLHVGASVPILIAEPLSVLTYRLVLGASLGTMLEGDLDVQLVRLDNNEVALDVGISRLHSRHARLTLRDSWGTSGLCEEWPSILSVVPCEMELGGRTVNVANIVENALTDLLDRRLDLLNGRAERSSTDGRISVARIRFTLDPTDDDIQQALTQAMRGDVRLAQALSMRDHPGVVAEFDLVRSGVTTTSYAGLDVLGMRFFAENIEREGSAVVQTPAGGMSMMFDSLYHVRGAFDTHWGYNRVGLAGLVFDANQRYATQSHANMLLQYLESDTDQGHDDVLDHIDAVIFALAGYEGLQALEVDSNAAQRHITTSCYDEGENGPDYFCYDAMVGDATVEGMRQEALTDFRNHLAQNNIEGDLYNFLDQLGQYRAMIQAGGESVGWSKPEVNIVVDYRIDDRTLNELMTEVDSSRLRAAMINYLRIADLNRGRTPEQIATDRAGMPGTGDSADLDAVELAWTNAAERYQARLEAEGLSVQGIGSLGPNAIEIAFPVSGDNVDVYEDAVARSLAFARSQVVTELYDELSETTDFISLSDLGGMGEQAVYYGLMSLVPRDRAEVRMSIETDDLNDRYEEVGWSDLDIFYQGENISMLDGAQFDIDVEDIIESHD